MADVDCGGDQERRPSASPASAWHGARDELGIPRLSVASVRALRSGDLAQVWLGGFPTQHPLALVNCPVCERHIAVCLVPRVHGARLDLAILVVPGDEGMMARVNGFLLFSHECSDAAPGKAVVT